jgi:3-hydroxyisobutyrate dehydrogenase
MSEATTIGFIGLGVMGEPICRNLVKKSGRPVVAFDLSKEPLARLQDDGARVAPSIAEVMKQSAIVFYCLPSGKHVRGLFEDKGGILENVRAGQTIVDLGTSPVGLTRELAKKVEAKGASFADAPIARTREAAINGTLSVMVGATPDLFAKVEPLIRHFASEVTNCGGTGAGQVVKILNNMVLFQTVNALSEAAGIARRSGVDPKLLFETLSKGSADSFAFAQSRHEGGDSG